MSYWTFVLHVLQFLIMVQISSYVLLNFCATTTSTSFLDDQGYLVQWGLRQIRLSIATTDLNVTVPTRYMAGWAPGNSDQFTKLLLPAMAFTTAVF